MTDINTKPQKDRLKNRRDIGRVVLPSEIMGATREHSSCCIGTEAKLVPGTRFPVQPNPDTAHRTRYDIQTKHVQ